MAPLNFTIPKVNAGSVNTRGKHNLSHNVATTFDFGRVQPVFCKLLTPDSNLKGSIDAKVRVMPMPLPPFGDVRMKLYGQFVSCKDLMHSYPEFISGQTYSSSVSSYLPTHVPRLFNYINPSLFSPDKQEVDVTFMHILATPYFSQWTAYPVQFSTAGNVNIHMPIEEYTLQDKFGPFIQSRTSANDRLNLQYITHSVNSIVFGIKSSQETYSDNGVFGFSPDNYVNSEQKGDTVTSVVPSTDAPFGSLQYEMGVGFGFSPESADFFFVIPYDTFIRNNGEVYSQFKDFYESQVNGQTSNTALCVAVSLNQAGRNLLTILKHLGINVNTFQSLDPSTNNRRRYVSLLPLFAFYKAYFDIFAPTRDIQWSSTNAHLILDWFNQTGREIFDLYQDEFLGQSHISGATFTSFLKDVATCYATCDPNYITQAVDSATPTSSSDTVLKDTLGSASVRSNVDSGNAAILGIGNVTRVGLQLLNQLSKFVNTNTVIGRNVNAFLKAHFGSIGTNENSTFAGSADVPITLGDVIVTANTELSHPGDFSGVGFGSGDYNFSYKADEFGFFIVLASIIPVSNYVQGEHYDINLTERLDFPFPEFDALGYDVLDSSEIVPLPMGMPYGYKSIGDSNIRPKSIFGYSPRYTGYKVHPSVYSGSFALRGLRNSYLGFTLDNYISQDSTIVDGNTYTVSSPVDLSCGTHWRYVNKYPMFNNYERIFYQQRVQVPPVHNIVNYPMLADQYPPYEDNFVAYLDVKCSLVDHLKSISNSYDTLDGSDFYVNKQ